MARIQRTRSNYHCSFCGKSQNQVERLIAGPGGVYICNECVRLCQEIIEEERDHPKSSEQEEPDEHQVPAPPAGRCPECHSERVVTEGVSSVLLVAPGEARSGKKTEFWALVCPECGYTMFYAKDPRKLLKE